MRALSLLFAVACITPLQATHVSPRFLVVGHRGAPRLEAENTIVSYTRAISLGANALELDVCVTADSQVVVWHDRDPDSTVALGRQAKLEGLLYHAWVPAVGDPFRRTVETLTQQELIDNYGYAKDDGVRDPNAAIVTFDRLVAFIAGASSLKTVYVDVKTEDGDHDRTELVFTAFQTALPGHDLVFLSPYEKNIDTLIALRDQLGSTFRIAWDSENAGVVERTESKGLRDVSTGLSTRLFVEYQSELSDALAARAAGKLDSITTWTIDDEDTLRDFVDAGVDAIMTNDPDVLFRIWQAKLKP